MILNCLTFNNKFLLNLFVILKIISYLCKIILDVLKVWILVRDNIKKSVWRHLILFFIARMQQWSVGRGLSLCTEVRFPFSPLIDYKWRDNRLVYSFNRNKQERRQVIRNQLHLSFLLKLKKLKVVLRSKTRKQHPERWRRVIFEGIEFTPLDK